MRAETEMEIDDTPVYCVFEVEEMVGQIEGIAAHIALVDKGNTVAAWNTVVDKLAMTSFDQGQTFEETSNFAAGNLLEAVGILLHRRVAFAANTQQLASHYFPV